MKLLLFGTETSIRHAFTFTVSTKIISGLLCTLTLDLVRVGNMAHRLLSSNTFSEAQCELFWAADYVGQYIMFQQGFHNNNDKVLEVL